MRRCINAKYQSLKPLLLFIGLATIAQSSLASIVMDLAGKDSKASYNVEIKNDSGTYSAIVTQSTKMGQSEVIYESSSLSKKSLSGNDEYQDGRLRVLDHKNGKATLILNNGENIKAELGE